MPTSIWRGAVSNRPPPGLSLPASYRSPDVLIGPWSWCAIGEELDAMAANNWASAAYPASDLLIAYPFEIADYFLIMKTWWTTGTTAGTNNTGVAVYSEAGTRLVTGSNTPSVANAVQEFDPTDTLLQPGRCWAAYSQNGTTNTPMASATPVALLRAMGVAIQSGSGLGATFTPAAVANAYMPLFGIAGRTQVA